MRRGQAYGLDKVQEIDFVPNGPGDPVPSADALLSSPTLKNAPLWPGFTSYLERWLDKQHAQRILQTQGNHMVYGPTLELFQQQQKLRTYYNFLGVDSVRYPIGGETRMFVSAVRETPLFEPVPWLAYWGQRFMLFTHGFGLVMAPAAETNGEGEPNFVSREIPIQAEWPEIAVRNPRVYYGEGSATMAFSNVDRMKELDYPTEQDRAEIVLPAEVTGGRADRFAPQAARVRLEEREVLRARLLRPDQGHHAGPLLPHAARPARPRRAVPLLRFQPLRGVGGRRDACGSSTP